VLANVGDSLRRLSSLHRIYNPSNVRIFQPHILIFGVYTVRTFTTKMPRKTDMPNREIPDRRFMLSGMDAASAKDQSLTMQRRQMDLFESNARRVGFPVGRYKQAARESIFTPQAA